MTVGPWSARGAITDAINNILSNHVAALDGKLVNTISLTEHLAEAATSADKLTAAALLHAWWGPSGDYLADALSAIVNANWDLMSKADHDGRCGRNDFGQCDICDDIRCDALADALHNLRGLLGGNVCADLHRAVTA